MFYFLDFIHVAQLDVLGFTTEYRYVVIILFSIIILYHLSKPIIQWLIRGRYAIFLTYLITSLQLLTTISILTLYYNDWMLIKMGLLAILLFGFLLALYTLFSLFKYLMTRKKIQKLYRT